MRLLKAVVVLAALAAMLAAFAALGGGKSALLDLFAHLTFPVALLALLALGLDLWLRKGRASVASGAALAALIACGVLMGPDLAAKARPNLRPKEGEVVLRVMHFNLWRNNSNPGRAAKAILESGADIVVTVETFQKARDIPSLVAGVYPHQMICHCGIAIMSRWPIVDDYVRRDTRRPIQQEPQAAWAVVRTPDGDVTVAGTHYTWPTDPAMQRKQLRVLTKTIAGFDKRRLVVTGDFNSTPWSAFLKNQDAVLGMERRTRALSSWPAGHVPPLDLPALFPVLPIDHVYAGSDWRTVSARRGARGGSDHYPVIVTLAREAP